MLVDGTFDELIVVDTATNSKWSFQDIDFEQDGFSFTCYLGTDAYPIVDDGYRLRGFIDGTPVAEGMIASMRPITHKSENSLRVTANPPIQFTEEIENME